MFSKTKQTNNTAMGNQPGLSNKTNDSALITISFVTKDPQTSTFVTQFTKNHQFTKAKLESAIKYHERDNEREWDFTKLIELYHSAQ
jgi:hypothetical protein